MLVHLQKNGITKEEQAIHARYEPVRDWIKKSINADFAARMVMADDDQKKKNLHFNSQPKPMQTMEYLSFAKGVEILKNIVVKKRDEDSHKEFIHGLDHYVQHGGFIPKNEDLYKLAAEKLYAEYGADERGQIDLMRGLIEAQTGFCRLTEEQYKALRELDIKGHLPREYAKIRDTRPTDELKRMPFHEFCAIVGDVRKEMGLPVINPGYEIDASKHNELDTLITNEFARLDALPKPEPVVGPRLLIGKPNTPYGKLGTQLEALQNMLDPNNEAQQNQFEEVIKAYNQIRTTNKDASKSK